MQKTPRFSSSGFAGCHNSTPLTMDLALEIRLMVPGRRAAIRIFSHRVDPRDTTNKRSLSVIVERTLQETKAKVEVSTNKATSSLRGRSKIASIHHSIYKANDKSSGMVATPSRTQSITMYTNRQIMQPTLRIQTEDLDKRGSEQRSDADSASDLAWMVSSCRKTPEGTNKEQRMVPQ